MEQIHSNISENFVTPTRGWRGRKRSNQALVRISAQRRDAHKSQSADMIVIEQYRSTIRQPKIQKLQLHALGLGRIGKSNVVPNIPVFTKIIDRLAHVVRVKPVNN
ncbi:MAG: mitochondrial large ribosomal subunit protein uL30m [Holosporales bacterium]|jgi:ribosomal protein L30/L7E|nr:mitochondrial large ribosomal subunit protein uL30m [Holosporales bacterium]